MTDSVLISAVIVAGNAGCQLERCLESLSWCDEMVVVDSMSQDDTVQIARRFTERVYQRSWTGCNAQKEHARKLARGKWVLNVDADEVATDALRKEIEQIISGSAGAHAAFGIPIRTFYQGRPLKYGGWYPSRRLRLYLRERASYDVSVEPHDRLVVAGSMGRLKAPLDHYSFNSLEALAAKLNGYATAWAQSAHARGQRGRWWSLAIRPQWRFLRDYIFRAGFLHGRLGWQLGKIMRSYTYNKYNLLREIGELSSESDEEK